MSSIAELAIRHLALRLQPLARVLQRAVERQAELAGKLLRPDVTPLCVTDEQVTQLLAEIDRSTNATVISDEWALSESERTAERELRAAAEGLKAKLPLDELRERTDLDQHELRMLLVCVAPEIDRCYERIYAYVLDDLNRRYACLELLTQLCARDWTMRMQLHALAGANGRLRRLGMLRCFGEAPTVLRQQLQCAPGLIEFLVGGSAAYLESLRDPDEVSWSGLHLLPPGEMRTQIEALADRLRQATLDCVAIWGPQSRGLQAALQLLSEITSRGLRRFRPTSTMQAVVRRELAAALERAAAVNAILWIDLEGLEAPLLAELQDAMECEATQVRAPLVISGPHP